MLERLRPVALSAPPKFSSPWASRSTPPLISNSNVSRGDWVISSGIVSFPSLSLPLAPPPRRSWMSRLASRKSCVYSLMSSPSRSTPSVSWSFRIARLASITAGLSSESSSGVSLGSLFRSSSTPNLTSGLSSPDTSGSLNLLTK